MDGRWFSQEVEESCGDGDLTVLILFELDDAPDELYESNDASDEDEGQNKLDDSGNDPSVEELVDSKSSNVLNGIAFGQSESARYIKSKRSFDIVYTVEDNIYKRSEVQLQIEDIKPSEE